MSTKAVKDSNPRCWLMHALLPELPHMLDEDELGEGRRKKEMPTAVRQYRILLNQSYCFLQALLPELPHELDEDELDEGANGKGMSLPTFRRRKNAANARATGEDETLREVPL